MDENEITEEEQYDKRDQAEPEVKHMVSEELPEEEPEENEGYEDPRLAIAKKYEDTREERDLEALQEEEELSEPELPDVVQVKVNGEVREVDRETIEEAGGVVAYQKDAAAAERLRIASEQTKLLNQKELDLRKREEQLMLREQQLSNQDATVATQNRPDLPNGDQSKVLKEKAKAYHEALLEGEDEKSEEALLELVSLGRGNNAIPEERVEQIRREVVHDTLQFMERQRYETDLVAASKQFAADYPEIISDPRLYALADQETAKVAKEHPDWSPAQIYAEVGQNLTEWRGSAEDKEGEAAEAERQAKLNEKRTMRTPRAGTGRAKTPKPKTSTRTNSQYINDLRKSRGLAV